MDYHPDSSIAYGEPYRRSYQTNKQTKTDKQNSQLRALPLLVPYLKSEYSLLSLSSNTCCITTAANTTSTTENTHTGISCILFELSPPASLATPTKSVTWLTTPSFLYTCSKEEESSHGKKLFVSYLILCVLWAYVVKLCIQVFFLPVFALGQAHEEGRGCGEVWYPLWRLPQKDGEEDRSLTAWEVQLLLLWEGKPVYVVCYVLIKALTHLEHDEAEVRRDLAL